MNIIKKPTGITNMLVGEQTMTGGIHYRPSVYATVTSVDGALVACNRLTRCLAVVSEEEARMLSDGVDDTRGAEELIKHRFLVPDDHDDYQFCADTRELLKVFDKRKKGKSYIIMTTLDCNARCFYCYQMGRNRTRASMTADTAKTVAEYIVKTAGDNFVSIQWYGGEPLLNPDVIDTVCTALKEAGLKYRSTMISNGYLFSDELLEKAVKVWNLERVQIPLDGTEEVYNKVKAYVHKDVTSAYAVVMDNIALLLDKGIRVVARINLEKHNKEDVYKLADELAARFSKKSGFAVYCDVLYENAGTRKPQREAEERLELVNTLIDFENYCADIGVNIPRKYNSEMTVTRCMADSGTAAVISPAGELGLCDHAMESYVYGSVFSDDIDAEVIGSWKRVFNSREVCKNCSNFPECVRLINCPDDGPHLCDEAYKKKKLHRHKITVQSEYRRIMAENMNKDGENDI